MTRSKSDLIWTGKDYQSRWVSLYVQERDHIYNEHCEMQNNFTALYETITDPDSVYASASHPNREVLFKATQTADYSPLITKTIVEYDREEVETGHVVTSFPTRKEGGNVGKQLYSKK